MKAVVFYEHADAPMEKFMEVFPKHQVIEEEFIKSERVIGTGAFANPDEGAMAIFVDRESAEEFVNRDPFVQEGLIAKVTIKEWNDELAK